MTASYDQARDEIFAKFNVAWQADSSAIAGYIPQIEWPGVERALKPDQGKHWARISTQSVIEQQAGFRSSPTYEARQRYASIGLIFVQLFCPKVVSTAWSEGQELSQLVRNAFRGKKTTSGVVFKDATIKELDPELNYYRFNVVAEFEYDEIG